MDIFLANKRLNQIMESKKINGAQLVELTEWNAAKVSRILNATRELTSSEIQELSKVLNVSEAEFFRQDYMMINEVVKSHSDLARLFSDAAASYSATNRGKFAGSPVGEMIRKDIPAAIIREAKLDVRDYKVVGSIGKGQFAEVAWVSIFDTEITETATRGVYLVYLFSVDGKSVYLSLNQGYTYFGEKYSSKDARNRLEEMANTLRRAVPMSNSKFVKKIDLGAIKSLGRGYESGNIWAIKYDFDNLPSDNVMIRDLQDLLEAYRKIKQLCSSRSVEAFYDFLLAESDGFVNLRTVEEEVTSENIPDTFTSKDIIDEPKQKKESVTDSAGIVRYPRDPKVAANSLEHSNYECCYDSNHHTFTANGTTHMYVEAHHLVPMKESDRFVYSIDVESNICSLCSVCHDCIHHGTAVEKRKIIEKLYGERKERLSSAGILVSLEQLLKFYGIE